VPFGWNPSLDKHCQQGDAMSMGQSTTISAGHSVGASTSSFTASRRRAVLAAGVGNVLEWYDFTVYAYLAVILGKLFFQSGNETAAVLATFAVFGVGFVARPIGGILIGIFGDKYGRKPALLLTFALMIVSTGMIGLLPTYATIGLGAPILLVIARLMQGISAGGEWGGAASFLVEWAPAKRRGLFGSFHPFAICVGQLIGAGVTAGLTSALGAETMGDWGWRIPFLLGALIAPVGLFIRSRVDETPAYQQVKKAEAVPAAATAAKPAFPMVKTMVLGFAFPVLQSVLTYLFLSYFPTFGQKYLAMTPSAALWSTVLATFVMGVSCLASGALSDIVGRRACLLCACVLSLVLSYPLISAMLGAPIGTIVLLHVCFAAINGLFLGALASALVEMFPTAKRMTGLTTAYNLQSMLFGGFAPFIAAWLIATTGQPISIAYFIIFAAILSGGAVLLLRETAHGDLQ
jgi:MHS family proline/betaine transporter-like MFS transporter